MRRFTTLAVLVSLVAAPAFADNITGRVLSYDPDTRLLVLDDKTVFDLANPDLVLPADITSGKSVTIDYETAGEDGFIKTTKIVVNEG